MSCGHSHACLQFVYVEFVCVCMCVHGEVVVCWLCVCALCVVPDYTGFRDRQHSHGPKGLAGLQLIGSIVFWFAVDLHLAVGSLGGGMAR